MTNYGYDPFNDEVAVPPSEAYLQSLRNFNNTYKNQIKDIQDRINVSACDDWNLQNCPFTIETKPYEQLNVLKMLSETSNVFFEKVMKVLVSLTLETQELENIARTQIYPTLIVYGHQASPDQPNGPSLTRQLSNESDIAIDFANFLPELLQIQFFIQRLTNVSTNLFRQLACLYDNQAPHCKESFSHVNLSSVWKTLEKLCIMMVTIDSIIESNQNIIEGFQVFQKVTKIVSTDPARFGVDEKSLRPFVMNMEFLEGTVLQSRIFTSFIRQPLHIQGVVPVLLNPGFSEAFHNALKTRIEGFLQRINGVDKKEIAATLFSLPNHLDSVETTLVGLVSLIAMYPQVYQTDFRDKSLFKEFWEGLRKVPVVLLQTSRSTIPFYPHKFLVEKYPECLYLLPKNSYSPKTMRADAVAFLHGMDSTFASRVLITTLRANVWAVEMESSLTSAAILAQKASTDAQRQSLNEKGMSGGDDEEREFNAKFNSFHQEPTHSPDETKSAQDTIKHRTKLIQQGLNLASSLQHLVTSYVCLYVALGEYFPQNQLKNILYAVSTLKNIFGAFFVRSSQIASSIAPIVEILGMEIGIRLQEIGERNGLTPSARLNRLRTDQLSALTLALKMTHSPITKNKIHCLEILVDVLGGKNSITFKDYHGLDLTLRHMRNLTDLTTAMAVSTDCSFLYYFRELYPEFFKLFSQSTSLAPNFNTFIVAIHDPLTFIQINPRVVDTYVKLVKDSMDDCLIKPLCMTIETRLRVDVQYTLHPISAESAMHAQTSAALSTASSSVQSGPSPDDRIPLIFCSMAPLRLFGEVLRVKHLIESYLSATFYNLTTLHLSDWKTYNEMSSLALQKFQLHIMDSHLPTQTLEQGLDVIEVTRNLHFFVSRYNYSMNSQLFIEKPSTNKTMNSMSVRHFANSIRTHGTGILNTTVNLAYTLLAKDLGVFCQFLQDEHIKSMLAREFRNWKKNKDEWGGRYPWENAQNLVKNIRRLGVSGEGVTFIEEFRQLLTKIGNVLGFIRMMRSGSQRYCSGAIKFVPDLNHVGSFKDYATQDKLSSFTTQCAESLDSTLGNLLMNFAEGTDFFQLLLQVFREKMKDDGVDGMYLRAFPFIIPAVTVIFVDSMISQKDSLSKKRQGAGFCDDGFAIGIAFILSLLKQNGPWKSLHWFDSVYAYLAEQRASVEKQQHSGRRTQEDLQTLNITLKKNEAHVHEFTLLSYAFSGARVLFSEQ
ncbi:putative WASH complex subunit 4 [Blattamonas nauphoetae]|uniref:WASH complex subunit 4 n=1 Tax=Blattamonas nauphoetae TaxID=2049346 RepID=A0ABQ9Y1W4_9EUKA|nr:putative WASH complex subunit 4 [Blattamonas nauphoetae]